MNFHIDSWSTAISGLTRVLAEKFSAVSYTAEAKLSDQYLSDLYAQNDLAAKICNSIPEDASRQGWYRKGLEPDRDKSIRNKWLELDIHETLVRASIWGRLFGGGVLVLGIDDGMGDDRPYRPSDRSRLVYVKDIDRRYISVQGRYRNPRLPKYGKPEIYNISDTSNPFGQQMLIHESRVIRFGGARTTAERKVNNDGWDESILTKVNEAIKLNGVTWTSVANMIMDSTLVTFKRKNLKALIAAGNQDAAVTRLQLLQASRDMSRSLLIDMDDEAIERTTWDVTGYSPLVDRIIKRICSAAEMPEMILFGQSPSGLAASGDNEVRMYYDRVKHYQTSVIGPAIERIDSIIAPEQNIQNIDEYELTFNPLWNLTETEDIENDHKRSQTIQNYINACVFSPEEVRDQIADELSLTIQKGMFKSFLPPKDPDEDFADE